MAGVLAPEARQGVGDVGGSAYRGRQGLFRRQGVEMCASSSAWLVRAIGAVAAVVIDLRRFEDDGGMPDAFEGLFRREELGDCVSLVSP